MPTAIQTLKWRGFGFDRGEGYVEIRVGMIGFAFLQQEVWETMRRLRADNETLRRENEKLRADLQDTNTRLFAIRACLNPSVKITRSATDEMKREAGE
ncbi:hypothetical protein [Komagataeibacter oboediens]|uniref:hypothetical protein n=1 Tax=Komagataeibacter oboediens TaxID=65958 RepID=UPI000237ECAF|nr:hypothetical protein [Komagataeibacter oboediens]